MRRGVLVVAAVTIGLLIAAPGASAQSPAGCKANRMLLDIIRDRLVVRNGDVITYYVDVANPNTAGDACDTSNDSIWLQFPAPNGQPSGDFQSVIRNASYKAGASRDRFGPFKYTVNANPGVERLEARTSIIRGLLHDTAVRSPFNLNKTIGTLVTPPELTIDKVGSITTGQAPANVTYTYSVTNTSTTPVPMDHVTVSDNLCTGPTYSRGDDGDGVLSNGETWVFTCAMLHQAPGVYTNPATACAYSRVPGDTDRPVCTPPDTWTVTLTPPPAPPAPPRAGVLPASVTQAPCTLRTKRHLRVRARQLNTIRVRVRTDEPVANKTVRLKLPGRKHTIKRETNKKGVATFRVRPKRSGRARLTAGDCAKARISVKPARRVAARRVPRVTG
jgi:hypothetical protein